MKLVFMGTPDFAARTLSALLNSKHEILCVVTQPDKPKGRSGQLQPSDVKIVALNAGIPVFQPEKMRVPETYETIAAYKPDAIIVAAYGRIIPKNILELPKYGCINVHASLLPKYRGAAPIQWAILNGDEKTGVSIMQMNEGLDTGDIISKREVVIDKKETSDSLFDKLAKAGAELLTETLGDIEKGVVNLTPQPEESPTEYARMITKEDGRICWTQPAEKLERLVRGMNSWPGAFSFMDGKNVKIWDCDVISEDSAEPAGTIVRADKNALIVQTGAGQIKINELQLQGKKRMEYDAFLRGCRWEAGMKFGE